MRNILKATTLESKFPLLAVEGGCIISKDADITVASRLTALPKLWKSLPRMPAHAALK